MVKKEAAEVHTERVKALLPPLILEECALEPGGSWTAERMGEGFILKYHVKSQVQLSLEIRAIKDADEIELQCCKNLYKYNPSELTPARLSSTAIYDNVDDVGDAEDLVNLLTPESLGHHQAPPFSPILDMWQSSAPHHSDKNEELFSFLFGDHPRSSVVRAI